MTALAAPIVHQRAFGRAELRVKPGRGTTRLERLYQEGCAKIRLPRPEGTAEAVLINTAGGLTGGDRLTWTITAEDHTHLVLTTQAAERVYRSLGPAALVETRIEAGAGAIVEWLPQETILFEESHLHRRLEVDLAPDAGFLGLEAVLLGREAMGEDAPGARLVDDWRIRRGGQLLHAEATRLVPDPLARTGLGLLAENRAFATLVYVGPDIAARLEAVRGLGFAGLAASQFNTKLVIRALAPSGLQLRRVLAPVIGLLSKARTLPRLWTF